MTLDEAVSLIKRFEGFRSRPYLCPAGVPSIGYGTTRYPDGSAVQLTDQPVTPGQAEQYLMHDLVTKRLPNVIRLCPQLDEQGRLSAIVDFAYNLGIGALRASTLRRRINAEDWDDVPAQLLKWRFAGGKELRGLLLRRTAEGALV
jgi:lysozyme